MWSHSLSQLLSDYRHGLCWLVLLLPGGCQPVATRVDPPAVSSWFADITDEVGLSFRRDGGSEETFEMPQIMGSGGGMFDYDGDGDLDLFLIGGGKTQAGQPTTEPASRLFRQEAGGQFTDVTMASGLINTGYGMGIAVGDVDNDGDLDVFLSNVGDDRFFVNQGNGTFRDETELANVSDPKWSTACSFVDFDRDGWLDLVVVNYVDYLPGSHCRDRKGLRDFCGPQAFPGTVDRLYRNRGGVTERGGPQFEDVTVASGLASASGRGLGLICADFNEDERPDIFVANDMEPNHLWIQQEDGTFREEGVLRGVSVNQMGQPEANMGVVYEDLDGDGRFDLFVTHLNGESNTLWKGEAGGLYRDITPQTGLGPPSLQMTGFGVAAVDLNQDGALDLMIVNGHVKRPADLLVQKSTTGDFWSPYAQANQLFVQQTSASGRYRLESRLAGPFESQIGVSRGLISGDIDQDGDVDFVVTSANGTAQLYRNEVPQQGAWLQIRATQGMPPRDATGARVTVEGAGRTWTRIVQPSSGYLSHHDTRLYFGLGDCREIDRITVYWPDRTGAQVEDFAVSRVNQSLELRRGSGVSRTPDFPPRF
jgi:hypothetical protein